MSDREQREAALNRARVAKHRVKMRTPEVIEEDRTMEILKRQGYAVDTDGMIEPYRRHESDALVSWDRGLVPSRPLRYSHQHLAVIQINTSDSKLVDAVVATVDEPCALVGISKAGAVLVLRIGDSGYGFEIGSPPTAAHEFVTSDGKAGLFTATAYAQPLDVAAYVWRDERSPLNTHVMMLPPMHLDIAQAASGAVGDYLRDNGGRWGPLVLPEDPMQASIRRGRALMAARAETTPEEAAARADEALLATHPTLRPTDGIHGLHVDQARQRIEGRKAAKAAEKKQQADAAAKAKFKELQARLGNPT
jgi:hypothetical protein